MLTTKNVFATIASLAVASLALTGCAAQQEASQPSGNPTTGGAVSSEPVTITLSTFGNFGYTDEFLQGFMDEYPHITVIHNIAADGQNARTNLFTGLAAGSGLADVEAIESSWVVELREYADRFVPVPEGEAGGPWVGIQTIPVTTADGTLFAYPVGIGPAGICYRADLLDAAGLPSEPDQVASLLTGSWDNFFQVGQRYSEGSGGKPWFDTASGVFSSIIGQMDYPFEDASGAIVADTNPAVEKAFRQVLANGNQSARLNAWTDDWYTAMGGGGYATMSCPSWMLGLIEALAPDVTSWRVADVFPGGGGNVGGSYLSIPSQGKNQEAAALLAQWLTAPEQQVRVFGIAGTFPSRVNAYALPALADITNDFFGGQNTGQIFINRSEAITSFLKTGPNHNSILLSMVNGIDRVESGLQTVDQAWDQITREIADLRG